MENTILFVQLSNLIKKITEINTCNRGKTTSKASLILSKTNHILLMQLFNEENGRLLQTLRTKFIFAFMCLS